ncbi:plexin-B1-like isoform X2 [Ruditapes philippinarum]|uniref:plexin-B1-like isoform X2 n=1 Tax=Ruditapes philippinarum TaxID=129788 RepID=UPI00295A848C|nr:plexin-B1-like isoform X2 [Ruditapes philippinarum]
MDFTIQCEIPTELEVKDTNLNRMDIKIDKEVFYLEKTFTFLPNPTIEDFSPRKGTVSGGTGITIRGKNLTNANVGRIETTYKGESKVEYCNISSSTEMLCKAPEAPKSVKSAITNMINSRRRKRSDCSACIKVIVKVYLDGYSKAFDITYYRDPSLYKFEDKNNVHLFDNDQQKLTIKGAYINLVAKESDVNITIGLESCSVFELRADSITCLAPKDQPASGRKNVPHPEVNVTIGNYFENVGYLEYVRETEMLFIILGAVVGGVFALAIIGIIVGCYKYRKVGKRARAIEKNLSDMEMEIKRVAREEFLDMHTTMSSVNKNLVEQGFPYHPYQQFACNVMFSVDYLWTEPVMTDDERLKANRGMESLESLIYNKFFLVSVISTMENEKRFFIREKSNLAGNLCAVLMGRMDYLDEILKLLMNNLVQDSPARKHKALFRRCESITEKLLSNWLSLCLYPHVKSHSGSPLYLLYMATQKTMESGPIDAVTGDAKYTLSEEKLLKKWSSSMDEDNDQDLKFEAKTLTLNVVVDNGDEIFKCKVLDCDTISQVKNKCLNQIYVNFPASKLPVGANDLELEWHEGFGGTLKLRDEDNTSKREGKWVRFNTLAHYNVKDESNMALIDPHSADNNLEDYVNLANINMDGVCDGSIDSSQPLTLHDPENPHECEQWHLVSHFFLADQIWAVQ